MHAIIDGRALADELLNQLHDKILALQLTPRLDVILIGDNPASLSFITQKRKAAERIGASLTLHQYPSSLSNSELDTLLQTLGNSKETHGIIIQRPLPNFSTINTETLCHIPPEKDVDGFVANSLYQVPVAKAVHVILEKIFTESYSPYQDFKSWLHSHHICVLGKGETAGGPIIRMIESFNIPVARIDQSTINPKEILASSTIIISCVGKPHLIHPEDIQNNVILISVGISKMNGILVGDYDEQEIQNKASFYTPTPGGVGPVNVACLMSNLVDAAKRVA